MDKSPQLQNWPPSEDSREKNRLLLLRGAMCFQVGIVVLTVGIAGHYLDIPNLHDSMPEQLTYVAPLLFHVMTWAGILCPLFVLWMICKAPLGIYRKTVYILISAFLLVFQLIELPPLSWAISSLIQQRD